jgi:cysteine-S-conjugate beta-lyase
MRDVSSSLIHLAYEPPAGFSAPQPGIFKASTVIFPNVAAMRNREWKYKTGYTYGLHGTPTTYLLEEKLCELEGGTHCVLLPSGLAAIANTSMALLKSGDEVLIPDNAYGPNRALAEGELKAWGITHQLYDPMNPQDSAGLDRGAGLGHHGVSRFAGSGGTLPRPWRAGCAGQHLGRRPCIQAL